MKQLAGIFGLLTKREKIMLTLLSLILILWGLFYKFFPYAQNYFLKSQQLLELKKQFAEEKNIWQVLKDENRDLSHVLSDYNKKIPDDSNLSSFIIDLEKIADALELKILSIEPEEPIINQNLKNIPVNIVLEGSYNSIIKFINDLETQERVTPIDKMDLKAMSQDVSYLDLNLSNTSWTLSIRVNLYYLTFSEG